MSGGLKFDFRRHVMAQRILQLRELKNEAPDGTIRLLSNHLLFVHLQSPAPASLSAAAPQLDKHFVSQFFDRQKIRNHLNMKGVARRAQSLYCAVSWPIRKPVGLWEAAHQMAQCASLIAPYTRLNASIQPSDWRP
jgi:hypothetical protein